MHNRSIKHLALLVSCILNHKVIVGLEPLFKSCANRLRDGPICSDLININNALSNERHSEMQEILCNG
ncbi:MAG: hypothetical protein IPO27_03485 [Bacteroidetes bacterium]|nr:hypothetical protein [Bacteroidota bacterium]